MNFLTIYGIVWMVHLTAGTTDGSSTAMSSVDPQNCSVRCLPAPTQPTTRPITPSDDSATTRPMCDSDMNGTHPCHNETNGSMTTRPMCDPGANGTQACLNKTGENETGQLYSCDQTSGQCLYGCVEKYLAGPYCNLSCESDLNCDQCAYDEKNDKAICGVCKLNFYKQSGKCRECSKDCRRGSNSTLWRCNMEDGLCPHGCVDGIHGLRCSWNCHALCPLRACDQFTGCCSSPTCYRTSYCGCNCALHCSRRCLGGTCNRDCTCEKGCEPNGYYGPNCDQTCPDTCLAVHENATQTCNDTNGHCLHGCVSKSRWGVMCDYNCSDNCLHGSCDQNTGACTDGCVTQGWYGTDCKETCSSNCAEGVCDRITGICLHGCMHGFYGNNCTQKCRRNCKNNVCDRYNGTCTHGCVNGFFSNTCDRTCYINCANDTCAFTDGKCSLGCKNCFSGNFCEKACPVTFTFGYWIAGVGVTIFIILVVIIMITNWHRSTSLINDTPEYVNSPGGYEETLHRNYETLHVQEENRNYEMLDMSK